MTGMSFDYGLKISGECSLELHTADFFFLIALNIAIFFILNIWLICKLHPKGLEVFEFDTLKF